MNLKAQYPHLIALLIFLVISCSYFSSQFSNKVLVAGDYMQWQGMSKEIVDYEKKTGDEILWTNSMFGGMPAYQIGGSQNKNLIRHVKDLFKLGLARPAGTFILGMICFYILLIALGVNAWLAIIGSISFSFMTNNLVLLEAGHMTKVLSIMVSPLLIAGVIKAYNEEYILGFCLFSLGMSMNLMANHFQMTYYLGLVMSIYVMLNLYHFAKEKNLRSFGIGSLILLIGLGLSFGSTASKLWTTYEYAEDTMRGKPILSSDAADPSSSSNVNGLDWNYAMNWSNGWVDLLPSFIPLSVGGSSAEGIGEGSEFQKQMRRAGYNTRGMKVPLYWGDLPSTSGPIYFGAIIFFLFIFSCFYIKGPLKWWVLSATIITMMLSLGKNLPSLNRFIFDHLPFYNKFRTPNSILSITSIIIPLLGIYGIDQALKEKDKEKLIKPALLSIVLLGGISLIIALLGGSFFDFSTINDARYEQMGLNINALVEDRISTLQSSAFKSLCFMLIAFACIYAFVKDKLKPIYIIGILGLLILVDQMNVNRRYLNSDSFVSKRNYNNNFQLRNVDAQILKDSNPNYRVLDLSINTFNSSSSSYHHKTIGGYHPAKLQRYQDLIDRHISKSNQNVLNMLNTKYIIGGQPGQEQVSQNPAALGNAWFINNINIVESADEEIGALTNFDPAGDAIIHKEFFEYVKGLNPSKSGSINLISYRPDQLVYESNSNEEQLAVFSEIWYGPNKGWSAYIDGEKVDHIRANYALRAIRIPAGQHKIEFIFMPNSYFIGEWISFICSFIIIGCMVFYFILKFKDRDKSSEKDTKNL